jgi:hypothetical protein
MATEITARAERPAPDVSDDGDYETFSAALSASARGRAFLTEYARRNRNADTEQLLAAIAQLQQTVAINSSPKNTDTTKAELRVLLNEIATAQGELEASIVATKATKLAELVALVTRRITAIMASAHVDSPLPTVSFEPDLPKESIGEPKEAIERAHLAVVPTPEQPELPIPSPLGTPLPSIALVRSEVIMEEVAFVELLPLEPDENPAAVETGLPKIEVPTSPPASTASVAKPIKPTGPLASIMALSEEERLALFT